MPTPEVRVQIDVQSTPPALTNPFTGAPLPHTPLAQSLVRHRRSDPFLLTLATPAALRIDNAIRPDIAEEWVEAHDPQCKDAALALLNNIQYISLPEFLDQLYESVKAFEQNVPDNEVWYAFVEARRGSRWVLEHARPMLQRVPRLVGDVELTTAFASMLTTKVPSLHIAYFDDASYSGEQLYDRIDGLVWRLAPKTDSLTVHVVCPFMTDLARRRLATLETEAHVRIVVAGEPAKLYTIGDLVRDGVIPQDMAALFDKMYPEAGQVGPCNRYRWDSVTLAYMAHKVPDGWSCLDAVLRRGEVRNARGGKLNEVYHFIPKTVPPYRNTFHW